MTRQASAKQNTLESNSDTRLCHAHTSQLVVIDVQTKLGSAMPVKVVNRVVDNMVLLLNAAQLLELPVLATEQYPKGLGPLEPRITERLPASSRRFEKTSFSCVYAPGFLDAVKTDDRNQIILTGMEAHICVLQTAVDLVSQGFQVFVVEDAVCSRKLEHYQNALGRMQEYGVSSVSTESVIFEWIRDAQHKHFKAIADLLQ